MKKKDNHKIVPYYSSINTHVNQNKSIDLLFLTQSYKQNEISLVKSHYLYI